MHHGPFAGRPLSASLLAVLVAVACTPGPGPTPASSSAAPSQVVTLPDASERPFAGSVWPATGSACGLDGYTGRLGRIVAVTARTVRFDLCGPDGAFPARLAHPALGIVDASSVAVVEADPALAVAVPGAGPFRVDAWIPGDNVRLARLARADGNGSNTVILRWAASSADRAAALRNAEVDGIDAPGPAELAEFATLPELTVSPRSGLATAFLGFGSGRTFSRVAVRQAFAQGIDTEALARDAFPLGSTAASWLTPCAVTGGCGGEAWYEFNGPAGVAALAQAGWEVPGAIPLHVPDVPVPGVPDPAGVAVAIRDQLAASLGVTVEIDVLPAIELAQGIADGSLDGLYLWGEVSSLADPSGFLEPLFASGVPGRAATRARAARAPLREAAVTGDGAVRQQAFAAANDAVRSSAAVVPLVHPGSAVAYRSDVTGVVASPLGADPLGNAIPGDRSQLVLMGVAEPQASWCAIAPDPDSLRLCALVTPGLYAFAGGGLVAEPALASRCTPSADATSWTCRLRGNLTFSDGMAVDAGDVLASFRAQADAAGALRQALPAGAFAAWDELFGGPVPVSAAGG